MFDTLCALPLTSELFAQSLHPTSPLLAVGLAGGHVQLYRIPVASSSSPTESQSPSPPPSTASSATLTSIKPSIRRSSTSSSNAGAAGLSLIETAWRTRRHKGSCRALGFSPDGELLFSAGSDGLVKCARTETGRVEAKIAVPESKNSKSGRVDQPCLVKALTHTAFLLGTDGGTLYLYDTRMSIGTKAGDARGIFGSDGGDGGVPVQTWQPHGDYVTSLTAVPASESSTSGLPRSFVTTGDTTLSLVDVRKGVVVTSSPGRELLSSSAILDNNPSRIFTGDSGGSLFNWDRSAVKDWEFGVGRNKVAMSRPETMPNGQSVDEEGIYEGSIDAICGLHGSTTGRGAGEAMLATGWDTGKIEIISFQGKKGMRGNVVSSFMCDEQEGVVALDVDVEGRLVAGAGDVVKIYGYKGDDAVASDDEDEDEELEDDDDEDEITAQVNGKRHRDGEVDSEGEEEADSSDEEQKKTKRKKRKKNKQKQGKGSQQSFSFAGLD